MHATLILNNGAPNDTRRYYLEEFPVVLGRGTDADVRIADPWISRNHCTIDAEDGTLVLADLDTSNGTFVNGCRVVAAPLLPGDHLIVGTHVFRVAYERLSLDPPPPTVYSHEPEVPPRSNNVTQQL